MLKQKITISIDDGSELDWRVAGLLRLYGLKATFYWSPYNPKHEVMPEVAMREFIKAYPEMEIGQHTYNHQILTEITEWQKEIDYGYDWHVRAFNKRPKMFCYPRGYTSKEIVKYLKTKYIGARCVTAMSEFKEYGIGTTHLYNGEWVNRGGPNHYFIHSWEIDKFNDWNKFEDKLKTIKESVTNSEYVDLYFK